MPWFYCPELAHAVPPDATSLAAPVMAALPEEESTHARRVLRLQTGAPATLFDGQGLIGHGVFARVARRSEVTVQSIERVVASQPAIEVATAIPKGSRADDMVRQLSQLGVARLIPLSTERSVVDPRQSKLEKFARAAIESAKQCERAHVLQISEVAAFDDLVADPAAPDVALLAAAPRGGGQSLPDLAHRLRSARSVRIYIGPEGGWSERELQQALASGALAWTFAPHVLRIETAVVAAAAVVAHALL